MDHAEENKQLPSRQSAYRRHHNSEAAVVSVMNDIIGSTNEGQISALVVLDLSAAFDKVDYFTLLDLLQHRIQTIHVHSSSIYTQKKLLISDSMQLARHRGWSRQQR